GFGGAIRLAGEPAIRRSLRGGDIVVATNETELVLVLESGRDEEVPAILARLAALGSRGPMSFGLVHCPGDGTDAEALIAKARSRLAEAGVADARVTNADQPEGRAPGTRHRGTRRTAPVQATLRAAGGQRD